MFRGGFCSVCQVDVSALELLNSSIGFCFKWSISLHEQFLFISAMGIQITHVAFWYLQKLWTPQKFLYLFIDHWFKRIVVKFKMHLPQF